MGKGHSDAQPNSEPFPNLKCTQNSVSCQTDRIKHLQKTPSFNIHVLKRKCKRHVDVVSEQFDHKLDRA